MTDPRIWPCGLLAVTLFGQFDQRKSKSVAAKTPLAREETEAASSARGPRRLFARRKLISAAYDVMGRNGFEASTLTEIIDKAGVGVGSFYRYFSSKEELAKAVFAECAEELGAALEQVARSSTNIAAATGYAFRRFLEEAENDKIWASFILQLEPSMQMLDGLLRDHARAALKGGIESGELSIHDIEAGITAIHAIMIAIAKSMLNGALTPQEAHRASRFAMRMFGVAEDEAVRLSNLSMTELRAELQATAR